ncbi:MAG: NADH-quinone oxidoreductase subunit J, partial [Pirellulales bacterium]
MEITLEQKMIAAWGAAALGLWLMLPPRSRLAWGWGAVLAGIGAGVFFTSLSELGDAASDTLYWILAAMTLGPAVGTVSARSPVASALWFAVSLLGTGGLFLFQGAPFLAAATVIVYAGAIVVTFLFVLMLAQPDGSAFYDRIAWGGAASGLATMAGTGLVAALLVTVIDSDLPRNVTTARGENILATEHVARVGAELFTRHLLGVEIAGTLLLIALVGAVALVMSHRPQSDLRSDSLSDAHAAGTPPEGRRH